MGQVVQAGVGQAPARQASIAAGIPTSANATTLNKVCASGLEAINQAGHAIRAGDSTVVVAGGMESMSQGPHLLPKARFGYRMGPATLQDSVVYRRAVVALGRPPHGHERRGDRRKARHQSPGAGRVLAAQPPARARAPSPRAASRPRSCRSRCPAQRRHDADRHRRGAARRYHQRGAGELQAGVCAERHGHRRQRTRLHRRRGRDDRRRARDGRRARPAAAGARARLRQRRHRSAVAVRSARAGAEKTASRRPARRWTTGTCSRSTRPSPRRSWPMARRWTGTGTG